MTVRDEIAAAAETVAGVKCTPFYKVATKPGSAYVEMRQILYPNRLGGVTYWAVVIVLPQDVAAAEKWMEDNATPLEQALRAAMSVTAIRPDSLAQVDSPIVKTMVIEGHRAQ